MSWAEAWRGVLNPHLMLEEDDVQPSVPFAGLDPQSRQHHDLLRRIHQGAATYRSGRVSDVRIEPGRISGRIQGSRATPFLAEVQLPTMTDEQWTVVIELLASTVRFSAKLLADQDPLGLLTKAEEAGVNVLPSADDLTVLAGHHGEEAFPVAGAALWEAVADQLESSPFPLLTVRGRGRQQLLRDVTNARTQGNDGPQLRHVDQIEAKTWSIAPLNLDRLALPQVLRPDEPAPGLRALGEPDGWSGAMSPTDLFASTIASAADNAVTLLSSPSGDAEDE